MRLLRITEKLGFREEVIVAAREVTKIFTELLPELDPNDSQNVGGVFYYVLSENEIDLTFEGVNFTSLNIVLSVKPGVIRAPGNPVRINSFAFHEDVSFDPYEGLFKKIDSEELVLIVSFDAQNSFEISDLQKAVQEYVGLESTIAHELKHAFDSIVVRHQRVEDVVRYDAVSFIMTLFTSIPTLHLFIFSCYFLSRAEILVKPTELASKIKSDAVRRSQFVDWFSNADMIKALMKIRELNWEKFVHRLLVNEIDSIRKLLSSENIVQEDDTDEFVVFELLRIVVLMMNRKSMEIFYQKTVIDMGDDALNSLLKIFPPPAKTNLEMKLLKIASKYEENPSLFFMETIKRNSALADKVIKKLAGLFAIAAQDEGEVVSGFSEFAQRTKSDQ